MEFEEGKRKEEIKGNDGILSRGRERKSGEWQNFEVGKRKEKKRR